MLYKGLFYLTLVLQLVLIPQGMNLLTPTGYLVIATDGGLEIQAVDREGNTDNKVIRLSHFGINQDKAEWIVDANSLAVSPDALYLAFVAISDDGNLNLFLSDLLTGELNNFVLKIPASVSIELHWSPDSSALLLDGGVSKGDGTYLFELDSGLIFKVIDTFAVGLKWLPDSQYFVYIGPSVCTPTCGADNDLYLGQRASRDVKPLTALDPTALGIADRLNPYVSFGNFVWSSSEQRIYVELSEAKDFGGLELLYSVDLQGNMRFEADITALYPQSKIAADITDIFSSVENSDVYLVTETQGIDNTFYRWSILTYNPTDKIRIIHETDFSAINVLKLITSIAVAPDGLLIAIGGGDQTRQEAGRLQVINVQTGEVALDLKNVKPVCKLYWSDNKVVVYGQSDSKSCWDINRLVWHNLEDGSTKTIAVPSAALLYFLPLYG